MQLFWRYIEDMTIMQNTFWPRMTVSDILTSLFSETLWYCAAQIGLFFRSYHISLYTVCVHVFIGTRQHYKSVCLSSACLIYPMHAWFSIETYIIYSLIAGGVSAINSQAWGCNNRSHLSSYLRCPCKAEIPIVTWTVWEETKYTVFINFNACMVSYIWFSLL